MPRAGKQKEERGTIITAVFVAVSSLQGRRIQAVLGRNKACECDDAHCGRVEVCVCVLLRDVDIRWLDLDARSTPRSQQEWVVGSIRQ